MIYLLRGAATLSKSIALVAGLSLVSTAALADDLKEAIDQDYRSHLAPLFKHFHANPELSSAEHQTAKRIAKELRAVGFEVHEGIGGTGIIALLKNGDGPVVMVRADMDGLPLEEKSGLPYASKAKQTHPESGEVFPVMHACGHDVHITALIGTARQMAKRKSEWQGTLMLVGQPAEETISGAKAMMAENIWQRFPKPDYALAWHVAAGLEVGKINLINVPFSGSDTVDIFITGIGAHGASPQAGKDPVVLGSQIVLALQTLVSRELAPMEAGVVTVGAFHSGTKHNIISDAAHLQLTVRNNSEETRKTLLDGIARIAENMGRVAGLPEDKLPKVEVWDNGVPPTVNNIELMARLGTLWKATLGEDAVMHKEKTGMGAEDFGLFTTPDDIPSVYASVGGTSTADLQAARRGELTIASHHSPLFKIDPDGSVPLTVEASVIALLDLMAR